MLICHGWWRHSSKIYSKDKTNEAAAPDWRILGAGILQQQRGKKLFFFRWILLLFCLALF